MNNLATKVIVAVVATFCCHTLLAATTYVGSCGTPNKSTIQAAVTASHAGDTIKVCPGNYPEQVTIKIPLNLVGVSSGDADAVVISSPSGGVLVNTSDLYQPPSLPVAAQVLVQGAKGVNISNITVDGSGNQLSGCGTDIRGIYYQNASGTISAVATRNQVLAAGLTGCQAGQGIFVQSSYPGASGYASAAANVTIQNSSVHLFQKNGITIDGPKATGNIVYNQISGQGPTTGAAENGVQISDGAAGCVTDNVIMDEIWAPDTSSDTGDAAAGILVYASENVLVQNNIVGTTQFGIATVTDIGSATPNNQRGLADHTTIASNIVLNTQLFDAIDVCSNDNSITGNTVFNATESGIHLDSTCGATGQSNSVANNTVNESCAGVLEGAGGPSGVAAHNSFFNVANITLSGNTCTVPTTASVPATLARVNAVSAGGVHPIPVQ